MEWDKAFFLFQGAIKTLWQSVEHKAADGAGR